MSEQAGVAGAVDERPPLDLVAEVEDTLRVVRVILDEAQKEGSPKLALLAAQRVTGLAELLARLRGTLNDGATVSIHMVPEFRAMQETLLSILAPHPELRAQVARALLASSSENGR